MKKHIKWVAGAVFLLLASLTVNTADAQRYKDRGNQDDRDEYRKSQDTPDSLQNKSFVDRLVYGGNFAIDIGNPTYIDISPYLGYKVTPKLQVGLGATYDYINAIYYDSYNTPYHITTTIYGGRVYGEYDIFHDIFRPNDKIFLHGEYEWLNVPYITNLGTTGRTDIYDPYVGGGIRSPFGMKGYFNLSFLYNVDYVRYENLNPYGSPFLMRIGFSL